MKSLLILGAIVLSFNPISVLAATEGLSDAPQSSISDVKVERSVLPPRKKLPRQITFIAKNPSWFAFGNCTRGVAEWTKVYWPGNAGEWDDNAMAMGFKLGKTPQVGAIMVTNESFVGHVALVVDVDEQNQTFKVKERNYQGWNVDSYRTLPWNFSRVQNFIYVN